MKYNSRDFTIRKMYMFNFILFVFILIIFRYFYIQIIKNDFFKQESGNNSSHLIKTKPPRGFILDRNGKVIVSNRSTFSVRMYPLHYNDSLFDYSLFYEIMNKASIGLIPSKISTNKPAFLDTLL